MNCEQAMCLVNTADQAARRADKRLIRAREAREPVSVLEMLEDAAYAQKALCMAAQGALDPVHFNRFSPGDCVLFDGEAALVEADLPGGYYDVTFLDSGEENYSVPEHRLERGRDAHLA
jgi:hypothetical protein